MRIVFLFGNARLGEFEGLRRPDRRIGLIRDVSNHGLAAPDVHFDLVLPWDPADGVNRLAADLRAFGDVAVLNLRETYVEPHALLVAVLGQPGMDVDHVGALRSKALMRARFPPGTTGAVAPAGAAQDVLDFGAGHGWPVIVKPEALYSSLFVTLVHGPEDVVAAFPAMRDGIAAYVRAKGLPQRFYGMQVEEYLSGSNHSVDLVVDAERRPYPAPVVDVITTHDLGGPDFSHIARFSPSRAPADAQAAMQQLAVEAVAALGMRRCAAHVEFILTTRGPRLLEAAVRPGGHRIRMLDMGHGINFAEAYLAVHEGRVPDLAPRRATPFAIVTPFPRADGRFAGVAGLDAVAALPTYLRHAVHLPVGARVGLARSGNWQVIAIELAGRSADLERDVTTIAGLDLVRSEA